MKKWISLLILTVVVSACQAALAAAPSAPLPPCWHDSPTGAKLDWRTDDANFAIRWLCNVNGAWQAFGIYGQFDELENDYVDGSRDFLYASDAERKAIWTLWTSRYINPLRDNSKAKVMFEALTVPGAPPKTRDTKVYYVTMLKNKIVLTEGGTVLLNTVCGSDTVNGMRSVPVASVVWTKGAHNVAVADCR